MTGPSPSRVLLVFVDGIGFGPRGAQNPFDGAPVDILAPLGGREAPRGVEVAALDACLGVPGLPQSGTGQTALFTGVNAAELEGRHVPAFPTRRLETLITARSFLGEMRRRGRTGRFLNAYDDERAARITAIARGLEPRPKRYPLAASSLTALSEGGALSTFADVEAGRAATFDLTGDAIRSFGFPAPRPTLVAAGRALVTGMRLADASLYETILLDKAGHARDTAWARREIVKLDRLLAAVFAGIDRERELVVVTSDHGNAEDLSTRSHTRALVPLLAFGVGAADFVRGVVTLTDVAPRILRHWPAAQRPLSSTTPG